MTRGKAILTLIFVFFLSGCTNLGGGAIPDDTNPDTKYGAVDYLQSTENESSDYSSLTIYYLPFSVFTRSPLSVKELMDWSMTQKIVIEGEEIIPQMEQLRQIALSTIKPTEESGEVNARLYYYFESGNGKEDLEVIISSPGENIIVNGIETEYNSVYYDVVSCYLDDKGGQSDNSSVP